VYVDCGTVILRKIFRGHSNYDEESGEELGKGLVGGTYLTVCL
jgi:hypothetical protein